jgi:hypothetical protein
MHQTDQYERKGTCACCFEPLGVATTGLIREHATQDRGEEEACAGSWFKPLEESTEGLEWMIWRVSERLGTNREWLDRKNDLKALSYGVHEVGKVVMKTIERDHPGWDRVLAAWTRLVEARVGDDERQLSYLKHRLARHVTARATSLEL